MRIGLVCPYSLDVPGGVQNHVLGLAEALQQRGHYVSVLAPGDGETPQPPYVVSAGRAIPVPYNGAVGRVAFGPAVAARVRRWLREGDFDVLHIHEPAVPSVSVLALWAAEVPVVATFHSAQPRSRALSASAALLRPGMEKIAARIAVSEDARETLVRHLGGEPVVIPNGVYVGRFANAEGRPEWRGADGTIVFVGRLDEPRKGFSVLVAAFEMLLAGRPGLNLVVVGAGDEAAAVAGLAPAARDRIRFLGPASDEEKAVALRSADLLVAPNTHGESFGIVIVEAMAAGTAVVASDLPAFRRVLGEGEFGGLFRVDDPADLARVAESLLADPARRETLSRAASHEVQRYDWATVATQIQDAYEMVVHP